MANSWRNSIRSIFLALSLCAVAGATDLKVEVGSSPPPPVRNGDLPTVTSASLRILVAGKLKAEIWLATSAERVKSNGERTNYRFFPFAAVGVLKLTGDWSDYRGKSVPAGTYLLRYAAQPPLKDHLGVSRFRDFLMLEPLKGSREGHPYVMALVAPSPAAGALPRMIRNESENVVEAMLAGEKVALVFEGHGQAPEL